MCDFTISLNENKPIMTVKIESPIPGFHPHHVWWLIELKDNMWYHTFKISSKNSIYSKEIEKISKRINCKRYRFDRSIVDVHMGTRRTIERLLKRINLRESDLNEIRAGLKPVERQLYEDIYKRENN